MENTRLYLVLVTITALLIIYILMIDKKEKKQVEIRINERQENLYRKIDYCTCKRPKLIGIFCINCEKEFTDKSNLKMRENALTNTELQHKMS